MPGGIVPPRSSNLTTPSNPSRQPHQALAVIILGPTGSGKTALSLALAQRFNGEVVSCDSVAVYRGMELGTAKPTVVERALVPHHLIDVANPDEPYTAGEYMRAARAALADINAGGKLPIVTGGTGLYLRALTAGLFAGPERRADLRSRLLESHLKRGKTWLHRLLTRLDPESAARIHANDTAKLIRAIEVCLTSRSSQCPQCSRGDLLSGISPAPNRPQPAARPALRPPQPSVAPRCSPQALWMKPAPCSPAMAPSRRSIRSATGKPFRRSLMAKPTCPQAVADRATGPQELRQAPANLVPSRAGRALDRALRRRIRNPARNIRTGGVRPRRPIAGHLN